MMTHLARLSFLSIAVLVPGLLNQDAGAQIKYSPTHPDVRDMIDRGVGFLAANIDSVPETKVHALIGLAVFNATQDEENPIVVATLERVAHHIANEDIEDFSIEEFKTIYYPCVAMIFMAEVDHIKYKHEIEKILAWLVTRQDQWGGWSYHGRRSSDISQSQYAALALWLANFKKFEIPGETAAKAAEMFSRYQNQNGTWGYQVGGQDASIVKNDPHPSRVAAGASSCYALSNLLELDPSELKARLRKNSTKKIQELPRSVIEVFEDEIAQAAGGMKGVKYNKGQLDNAKSKADRWFAQNYTVNSGFWNYYYLYGYERYVTFYELQNGSIAHQQNWYDRGVEYMKKQQTNAGNWPSDGTASGREANAINNTCFAILFLTRSTRNIIGQPVGGEMAVGERLPDPANGPIRIGPDGLPIGTGVKRNIADLINLIDGASEQEIEKELEGVESIDFDEEGASRNEKIAKLREAILHESWILRKHVVRLLAKERNIDNAPALIFALSDPDVRVARVAHNGLRMLSRRIDSIKVAKTDNEAELLAEYRAAKLQWEDWFLKLRPTGQLLDK